MYNVSSLFRISKQKRGTHTILNLSIQLSFFSTHIFHITHTFQENKEGYLFIFYSFYSCFIFIATIVDIIYHFGKQILNDETISIYSNEEVSKITFIMELLYFRFSTTSYFCIIIVSSYIVLKKYINDK